MIIIFVPTPNLNSKVLILPNFVAEAYWLHEMILRTLPNDPSLRTLLALIGVCKPAGRRGS